MDGSGSYVVLLVRARRLRRVGVWIAAVGARSVEDNLGWFVLGLGNAAQQKVADVGDDGGAAGGDAILGGEDEEARERTSLMSSEVSNLVIWPTRAELRSASSR